MSQRVLTAEELVPMENQVVIGKTNSRANLANLPCYAKCQVIVEILKHHPILNALTSTATVPIIYIHQFWHTLKLNESTKTLTCTIDQHEDVEVDLELFRTVLRVPQRTDQEDFVPVPKLPGIIKFMQDLGYDESETAFKKISHFKRKYVPQPWLTLLTIINRCTTGKETGLEGARLLTLQILWGVVNMKHIDYAKLIWEDLLYHAKHRGNKKADMIPFVRYTKLIIYHLMYQYDNISKRVNEPQHSEADDETLQRVKIDGKSTKKPGMRIPEWLLTPAVKETDEFKKYDAADGGVGSATGTRKKRMARQANETDKGESSKGKKAKNAKKAKVADALYNEEEDEILGDVENIVGGDSGRDKDESSSTRLETSEQQGSLDSETPPSPTTLQLSNALLNLNDFNALLNPAETYDSPSPKLSPERLQFVQANQNKQHQSSTTTSTSLPLCTHSNLPYAELKRLLLAQMLEQPELREADPELFRCLTSSVSIPRAAPPTWEEFAELKRIVLQMQLQQTCWTDVLRKRPHDDHDSDHHEGENAKRQQTIGETSSTQPPSSSQQHQDDMQTGSGDTDVPKAMDEVEVIGVV